MSRVRWNRQGAAVVGEIQLRSCQPARIVLVGPRDNAKGAVVVTSGAGGELQTQPLYEHPEVMSPSQLAQVVCMQERLFGETELPPPQI